MLESPYVRWSGEAEPREGVLAARPRGGGEANMPLYVYIYIYVHTYILCL